MRLVLDTSVVVSAVRSQFGGARDLVAAAILKDYELLVSVALAFEYESVLLRPEHLGVSGLSESDVAKFVLLLLETAVQVQMGVYRGPYSIDPADNHVLQLASYGHADAIVTYNTRHFIEPCKVLGVSLLQPGEALRLLRI